VLTPAATDADAARAIDAPSHSATTTTIIAEPLTEADDMIAATAADHGTPAPSNQPRAEILMMDEPGTNASAEAPDRAFDDVEAAGVADKAPAAIDRPSTTADTMAPRHPLRFMWQINADGPISIGSEEFVHLLGPHMAASLGGPWRETMERLGLDPDGRLRSALDSRDTWSGIMVAWPVDGGDSLQVELSGLPIFDEERQFHGYRGFGICRDFDALDRLHARRRSEVSQHDAAASAGPAELDHISAADKPPVSAILTGTDGGSAPAGAPRADRAADNSNSEPPGNVVPFRAGGEAKFPALTAVENSAFHELARQLSARLEGDFREAQAGSIAKVETQVETKLDNKLENETIPRVTEPLHEPSRQAPSRQAPSPSHQTSAEPHAAADRHADDPLDWLTPDLPAPQGDSQRDRILLDVLPGGVLIYRLDRLLYANAAFLSQMDFESLAALEQAGGLDALYVEPGVSSSSSTSEAGTPVMIAAANGASRAGRPAAARLFTISWDGDAAHALIFTPQPATTPAPPAAPPPAPAFVPPAAAAAPAPPPPLVIPPPASGHADAEDLGAILDATAEGVLLFDAGGNIHACNRSAEALFGYDGAELVRRNLIELLASESSRLVLDYLDSVRGVGETEVPDQGREVTGKVSHGGLIPLSIRIGRTRPDGANFFAVFRDLSQTRRGESELQQARRLADRAANAKADMLARISHEVRAPLNAIIGFAEMMIGERFGSLGNARYADYMKDIRSSGERVISLINDLLELSRIETGKLELAFTNQNLNELVEACVAVMQPQANRARIIIRTSLSHVLPPVVADARALRQIVLNLISTSIGLANPGGQVIVSTAISDFGEVVLRVRDTGHGLNDQEVAAALEPFRSQAAPSEQAPDGAGLSLSLTKALVEANRAQFHIKAAPKSGTLMEVVFSRALARNQGIG
jgi:PAS domain S-box-containing protein